MGPPKLHVLRPVTLPRDHHGTGPEPQGLARHGLQQTAGPGDAVQKDHLGRVKSQGGSRTPPLVMDFFSPFNFANLQKSWSMFHSDVKNQRVYVLGSSYIYSMWFIVIQPIIGILTKFVFI